VRDMKLFRFEFDNDTFLGSDDAFSAGWSIQIHSAMLDEWSPGLEGWIGRLPTLGDDGQGGRIVRWSWGVPQLILTPQDVTIPTPQLDDAPWAGMLGAYVAWTAYDNRRLAAVQAYLGCIGPCSQAEQVQKFVHNTLGFGERPEGWSNQIDDEILVNLNYEYRRKLWASAARYDGDRWGNDLSVGAQVGIGGFATYAEAWIEYRVGWDILQGFTKFADPPAFGIGLDPVYLDPSGPAEMPRGWRFYANIVARLREVEEFAGAEGGDTQDGGFHPGLASIPGDQQLIVGFHVAKFPLAFHLTYYRYLDDQEFSRAVASQFDWVNFSFERRF
jgi:lipid A 3-O-deacylase